MTIEALGAAELCNVYGSTETYGNCAVTDAHDPLALRLHSQGLPLPGMTIRAVDLVTWRPLAEGEIGEISGLLSSILVDAGTVGGYSLNFEAANEDAEKVLAEAAAVAETRMKEKFPEIPSGLPSMESSSESTS